MITLTLFNSKLFTISWTTIIFFLLLSNNVNDAVGLMIANGNPGKPPPVPTSIIFNLLLLLKLLLLLLLNNFILDIDNDGNIWLGIRYIISFLEIKLIFKFHSLIFIYKWFNLWYCWFVIYGKYCL